MAKADLVVELDKGALSYCIGMQFPQLREIACIGRKRGVSIVEAPFEDISFGIGDRSKERIICASYIAVSSTDDLLLIFL